MGAPTLAERLLTLLAAYGLPARATTRDPHHLVVRGVPNDREFYRLARFIQEHDPKAELSRPHRDCVLVKLSRKE